MYSFYKYNLLCNIL